MLDDSFSSAYNFAELNELISPCPDELVALACSISQGTIFSGEQFVRDESGSLAIFDQRVEVMRAALKKRFSKLPEEEKDLLTQHFEKLCSGWRRIVLGYFRPDIRDCIGRE